MQTVSLCMIVRDEETQLETCLSSVNGLADEIILADTGSVDGTKALARRYTDKIFDFPWTGDFSAARNFSFSRAAMDYILWLDADDVLLPADQARLKALKESLDGTADAFMMNYDTGFDASGRVTFSCCRERLVRRACGFIWREPVHEYLEVFGNVLRSDVHVTHRKRKPAAPGRNLAIYEKLLADGGGLSPRGTYYYARELKDAARFDEAARWFTRFLDGGEGWVEDRIAACRELAACHAAADRYDEALGALSRSFVYDTPRAETCCALGYVWKTRGDFRRAAFWFRLAAGLDEPAENWGFVREDCRGYIPCLELAVCYDALGQPDTAELYNERAAVFKPEDPAVRANREYFRALREKRGGK